MSLYSTVVTNWDQMISVCMKKNRYYQIGCLYQSATMPLSTRYVFWRIDWGVQSLTSLISWIDSTYFTAYKGLMFELNLPVL